MSHLQVPGYTYLMTFRGVLVRSARRSFLRTSSVSRFNLSKPPLSANRFSTMAAESSVRPEPDKVLQDIADYVHHYKIDSELAYETARLCLIDTIGCGLEGLRFPDCAKLLGPVVEGTVVPNGRAKSPQ